MYNTPGTYEVSLTVTDIHGTSSQTITDFITFENNIINLDIIEDFESKCLPLIGNCHQLVFQPKLRLRFWC